MIFLTFLFGIVVMQIISLVYHYLIFRKGEYLYYLLYSLLIALFVSNSMFTDASPLTWLVGPERSIPLSYCLLLVAVAMYYRFVRHFTDSMHLHKVFNRITTSMELLLVGVSFLAAITIIIFPTTGWLLLLIRGVFVVNSLYQLYLFVHLYKIWNHLNNWIFISTLVVGLGFKITQFSNLLASPLSIGSTLNQVLFLMPVIFAFLIIKYALIRKHRLLETSHQLLELRRQQDLLEQRAAISDHLRQDVRAGLHSLQEYDSAAFQNFGQDVNSAQNYHAKISFGIRSLMDNMNDVIWSLNHHRDGADRLADRLRAYLDDNFVGSSVEVDFRIGEELEYCITSVIVRKNLLIICKEAINNAMKHSSCSRINISLTKEGAQLKLRIEDNGCGLPEINRRAGHGFADMQRRAHQMQGELVVNSVAGCGTVIQCFTPLLIIGDYPN